MTVSAPRPLVTADELPVVSARHSVLGKRTELVRGELIVMAPAGGRHGQVAHKVALLVGSHVLQGNLGRVFAAETGFLLRRDPDTVRAPDVAFVAAERLRIEDVPSGFLEVAPDLAVEVVSPGDSGTAVRDKVTDWLAAGTRLAWVVCPETRSVVAHRPDHPARELHDTDVLTGAPVLPDFPSTSPTSSRRDAEPNMLEYLELDNVGPAPRMKVEFAPRVNLITGDNGLGKSFLLDTAWWVLTGAWPAEVNRRMTSGLPARPRDRKRSARIAGRTRAGKDRVEYGAAYSMADETWNRRQGPTSSRGLVAYAHADGSLSVWDPARNDWPRWDGGHSHERRPAYVFTETDVWDGLKGSVDGRSVPVCNGLLHDWSTWMKAGDANSEAMAQALRALSPDWHGGDRLEAGPPMRLSIDDARDIPSIRTGHAVDVPVLHASSGIRRVVALAYVLTWAWSEHRIAADLRGEEVVRQATMLFDEVESHLHPRWQRSMLTALRDVGEELLDGADLQLIASTHAPLVLGSTEPWFDPQKDAWFDLDLDGDPPEPHLRQRAFTPEGRPVRG